MFFQDKSLEKVIIRYSFIFSSSLYEGQWTSGAVSIVRVSCGQILVSARLYCLQTLPNCQYAQKVNILWLSLYTFEVLISSKQILITQLRMIHRWISWSIYTHHHSNGSCTSGCCELFQALFAWGAYTASDNAPMRTRINNDSAPIWYHVLVSTWLVSIVKN